MTSSCAKQVVGFLCTILLSNCLESWPRYNGTLWSWSLSGCQSLLEHLPRQLFRWHINCQSVRMRDAELVTFKLIRDTPYVTGSYQPFVCPHGIALYFLAYVLYNSYTNFLKYMQILNFNSLALVMPYGNKELRQWLADGTNLVVRQQMLTKLSLRWSRFKLDCLRYSLKGRHG